MKPSVKALFLVSAAFTQITFAAGQFAESGTNTTETYITEADGSIYHKSAKKYLSITEMSLTIDGQTATADNADSDALSDLLIRGEFQNNLDYMLPNQDLGYLSKDFWYLEYELTNTSTYRFQVTDYSIVLYALHGDNELSAIEGNVDVYITPGYYDSGNGEHSFTQQTVTLEGSDTSGYAGVSKGTWVASTINPFTIDPGESITLYMTVSAPLHNDHKDGHLYVGLEQFQLSGKVYEAIVVPEPTTATLSLLALAGLVARRRRASH